MSSLRIGVIADTHIPARAKAIPAEVLEAFAGYRIGLAHGHVGTGKSTVERALSHFPDADCVVFGHSHAVYSQWHGRTLAFNPGSATDRRRSPMCSYGFLYLEPMGIRSEIRYIERPA